MIVPVQDQLDAMLFQQREQRLRIGQPLGTAHPSAAGDGSAARETPARRTSPASMRSSASSWAAAEPARSPSSGASAPPTTGRSAPADRAGAERERCRRQRPASPREIIRPGSRKPMPGGANIGIVIAGNDADAIRRPDALQPGPRRRKFRLERDVDEIAGDRDVVRRLRLHVRHQRVEHIAPMIFVAVAGPVEIAERAFAREIAQAAPRASAEDADLTNAPA